MSSAIGVVVAMVCGSSGAAAQAKTSNAGAAEALFQTATGLVEAGDFATGCPKFEASFALYPSASTMLNIARCHEHENKLSTALDDYRHALALNRETRGEQRQKALEEIATRGIDSLLPRVPKLRIVVARTPPGLEIRRDGQALPLASLGDELPANPGRVEIRASAAGYRAETLTVSVVEGETTTVEITLQPLPPGVPTWVWISGGAGILLAGAATAFAVDDLAAIRSLREHCSEVSSRTYCAGGYDYGSDNARKNRDFGLFVGLGSLGVVSLGAAAVGLGSSLSSKPPSRERAEVRPFFGPGVAGALMTGGF